MFKEDWTLNNLQWLISHKIQLNQILSEWVTSFRCITLEWHVWPGRRSIYNNNIFIFPFTSPFIWFLTLFSFFGPLSHLSFSLLFPLSLCLTLSLCFSFSRLELLNFSLLSIVFFLHLFFPSVSAFLHLLFSYFSPSSLFSPSLSHISLPPFFLLPFSSFLFFFLCHDFLHRFPFFPCGFLFAVYLRIVSTFFSPPYTS